MSTTENQFKIGSKVWTAEDGAYAGIIRTLREVNGKMCAFLGKECHPTSLESLTLAPPESSALPICAHCKEPLIGEAPRVSTPDEQGWLHAQCKATYLAAWLGFYVGDLVESHVQCKHIAFTSKRVRGFDMYTGHVWVHLEGEAAAQDLKNIQHVKTNSAGGAGRVPLSTTKFIKYTVYKTGARLSKRYALAADGKTVVKESFTQLSSGRYRVEIVPADDIPAALRQIGTTFDALTYHEAIGLGVPLDGSVQGVITTQGMVKDGGAPAGAIPRDLKHFGWPKLGLLFLDGDDRDGLYAVLCGLYPALAKVAALVRPSVSACVADPVTGKGLKTGEHVYLVVDKPERSRDCLHALMRLAWVHGSGAAAGWLMPSACGSVLIRGPIDAIVGSPERLSYEGAGKVEQGLTALPRVSRVIGGTGMLNADDLIAFADRNAGEQQYRARIAAAKNDPAFIAKRDAFEADYRATHIKKGTAQRVKKGVAPDEAEKQATASYDAVSAAGTCERGGRTWIPLADDHVLYWPNGEAFTIADIRANPAQFNGRECCDPVEGTAYQSRNPAIIYTNSNNQIQIYSRAHGDAFAYVAPLDEVDWAELFARIEEARPLGSGDEPDEPAASKPAADEAWDPWRETLAPRLDHSLLPRVVREAAATSARVSGADADAFAIGYLVGLTACADTRLRITPKQRARDWSVPLLLRVLLVAPPSSMKSEVIKTARALAASLDIQERERHGRDVAAAEVGAMLGGAAMTRAAAKRARAEAARTVAAPRQRVCGDITIEKLADILGANPGGCAVIHEELSGWLGGLGRYTAKGTDAADRAFYCAMRDGSSHDRQRMTSPSVHIEHCAGSFLGAVQPDRLLEMKLPMADGLLQRFMPLIMREARGYEDSDAADDAKALLRPVRDRLAALVPVMARDPYGLLVAVPYKLTPEGAKLYQTFANDMRLAARTPDPSREFGECLNKMGPMWLSLALLFHLIEAEGGSVPERVSTEVARRADAIIREFFIPHAEQFYSLLDGSGSVHKVRSVATAILCCPKDEIVLRDVVHGCRVMRRMERNEQIQLMQKFETFGWLTRLDRYGPAHPRWRRTPGLGARFEEDLKREEAARAAVTAAVKGGR